MADTSLNARVTLRNEVAPGLLIMRVSPDGWTLPSFTPGQYTVLGLPGSASRSPEAEPEPTPSDPDKLIRRAYSIASSAFEQNELEFYISMVRTGALTPRLFDLKIGDPLFLGPKSVGMLTIKDIPPDQNIVFIATGTGLAPYMSMIRTHLEANETRKYAVLHGAYHSWDLGYRTELFMFQRLCKNFAYLPIISDPAGEHAPWTGPSGFVQSLWTNGALDKAWGFHPDPTNTHVFLCGHPKMIEDTTAMLLGEKFVEQTRQSPGQIHVEKYW